MAVGNELATRTVRRIKTLKIKVSRRHHLLLHHRRRRMGNNSPMVRQMEEAAMHKHLHRKVILSKATHSKAILSKATRNKGIHNRRLRPFLPA
jgi:hypothetical protein